MITNLTTQKTQDNNSDAGVSPDGLSLLTLNAEHAHTAGKRALSAKLLTTVSNLENKPDGNPNTDLLAKVTTTMLALDKSIRKDAKYLEDKAKTLADNTTPQDAEHNRLRVLADLCDMANDIAPEDYDLDKLEARLREKETRRD